MQKIVSSSNLALRFYKRDGWERPTLHKYLKRGGIIDSEFHFKDPHDMAYFIFELGSDVDVVALYDCEVLAVKRMFDDNPSENDLEYMQRMLR